MKLLNEVSLFTDKHVEIIVHNKDKLLKGRYCTQALLSSQIPGIQFICQQDSVAMYD